MSLFESHDEMLSEVETTLRMECEDAGYLEEPMLEAFIERAGRLLARLTSAGEVRDRMAAIARTIQARAPAQAAQADPGELLHAGEAAVAAVAQARGLTVDDLKGPGRSDAVRLARAEAMWTLHAARGADGTRRFGLGQIGRILGGRRPQYVMDGVRRWDEALAERAGEGAAR